MPYKSVPRLPDFPYTGLYRYSLTICTHRRQRVFVNREAVDLVLSQLLQTASLHLLVEGTADEAPLREFARVFKQRSAYHWKTAFGTRLWQRSYFEHVLRDGESPVKAATYILANPLRAGLADRVEDYPYLGSTTMSVRELLDSTGGNSTQTH